MIRIKRVAKKIVKIWPFRVIYRLSLMMPYFLSPLALGFAWTWRRTENSNFYYDLTDKNVLELAHFLSVVCKIEASQAESYINELRSDKDLRSHLGAALVRDRSMKDSNLLFGRRIGWYAMVRAMKPKLVVETGVS